MQWLRSHLLLAILVSLPLLFADDCSGRINNEAVIEAQPTLMKTVDHGKLYHIKDGAGVILLVVLRGSPREQGKALGQLTAKELVEDLDSLIELCKDKISKFGGKYLPEFVLDFLKSIVKPVIRIALDLTWIFTKDFTHPRYVEEITGYAEGSGVEYMEIVRANMFPELIKAACSLVGAWGTATQDHNVHFLRAFDWEVELKLTKNPIITVYHSTEPKSIPFATFGYVGLVGAFTALNANGLAIAEKYWYQPLDGDIDMSVVGDPWNYVIRDIAEFNDTLADAVTSLKAAHRTCAIHLGVATKKDNQYRGIRYSYDRLNVYDDKSYPQNDVIHPLIEGINYVDKGIQPTRNRCFADLLQKERGRIAPKFLYSELAARHQTGNCQLLVLDMTRMDMLFAYSTYSPRVMAYNKPMFHLSLIDLFALP